MLYRLFLMFCIVSTGIARANVIVVYPSSKINTLQQGLGQAHPGDTLLIKRGRYRVIDLVINKPVTLIGEDFPVLDGENKDEVLIVKSDSVTIKGLYICNTYKGSLKNYAGIHCDHVKHVILENNKLVNTFFPIYLAKVTAGIVQNNLMMGKSSAIESGAGIYLWYSSDISVAHNQIMHERDGIYVEFSKGCTIYGNICKDNLRYGLHFMFSDHCTYEKNIFHDNGAGVAVMYSKYIVMTGNRFEQNWGASRYGLLLEEIYNSHIYKNIFYKNTTAVFMEESNGNTFSQNEFSGNGWAVKAFGDCLADTFYHNNFLGNTFDVTTNGELEQDLFDYNYWDKYNGYDLNKDHIGDIPFYPVSLYSKILQNIPSAIILLHSFIVELMDKAQEALPSLIPTSVMDHHPLMQPVSL